MESKKLHYDEVIMNVFLFMIAGYETTSTALASCTYILATQSVIQDKLRAEIDEQEWNDENDIDCDVVMNMPYMDLFIKEVLRMYPITTTGMTRECNTSTVVCGHQIEKGTLSVFSKKIGSHMSLLQVVSFNQTCLLFTTTRIYGAQRIHIHFTLSVIYRNDMQWLTCPSVLVHVTALACGSL